jgi:Arc/MetJ-type ribon-helix-helix transcriptional regulator
MENDKSITFRMPEIWVQKLKRVQKRRMLSQSDLLREAVVNLIKKDERVKE